MKRLTVPARFAREIEITGKVEERTGWREQNESQIGREEKRNGRLVGGSDTSKERAEWCRPQWKKLGNTGPAEKERVASVPQRQQLASTQEPPVQSTRSQGGRESSEREPHLGEREGDQSGSMDRKRWNLQ